MEAFDTPAVVVRVVDYGEADRIVTLLTRARGKLAAMARGARKSRRRFAGGVGMFAHGRAKRLLDNDPTTGIVGLRVEDGKERWHYHWHIINNERPITQPLMIGTNQFMVSAAYMTGCAAFEVVRTNDVFQVNELWKTKALKTKFASGCAAKFRPLNCTRAL